MTLLLETELHWFLQPVTYWSLQKGLSNNFPPLCAFCDMKIYPSIPWHSAFYALKNGWSPNITFVYVWSVHVCSLYPKLELREVFIAKDRRKAFRVMMSPPETWECTRRISSIMEKTEQRCQLAKSHRKHRDNETMEGKREKTLLL